MNYFEKIEQMPANDILWNMPERKRGAVNIIGGNAQSFRAPVKIAEYLSSNYPIETVNIVLPDVLKNKLPPLDNFRFLPSTTAGSIDGAELIDAMETADFNLIIGDLSKNAVTGKNITSACESSAKPLLITRDTVDIVAENGPEKLLLNENLIIMGSLAQLQKILRAVYYPKILLLSQSLIQVADVLHKFTLSYPISLTTLHSGQILVAKNGVVKATSITNSGYSPIMLWVGEMAAKIVALNLFNPNNFITAALAAIYHKV